MCSAWLSRRSKTTTWRSKAISRGQVGGQRRFFHGLLTLRSLIFAIAYSVFEGFSKFRQSARKTLSKYENSTRNASAWVQNPLETLPRQPKRLPRGSHEAPKTPQEASKTLRRWPKRLPKRFQKRPHGFQDVPRRQLASQQPVREAKLEAQSVFLADFSPSLFSRASSRGQVGGQRRFFHGFLTLGPLIFAILYSVFKGFSKFRQSAWKTLSEYENSTRNALAWVQNAFKTFPRRPKKLRRGSQDAPRSFQDAP